MFFSNWKVRTEGRTDSSDFSYMLSFHSGHVNNAYNVLNIELFNLITQKNKGL
jgi:hypothetical protein